MSRKHTRGKVLVYFIIQGLQSGLQHLITFLRRQIYMNIEPLSKLPPVRELPPLIQTSTFTFYLINCFHVLIDKQKYHSEKTHKGVLHIMQ